MFILSSVSATGSLQTSAAEGMEQYARARNSGHESIVARAGTVAAG